MGAAVVGVTGEILSTTFFAPARMKTPVFMRYSAHGGDCAPRSERASCRGAARLILAQYQQLITQDEQLLSREREIEHLKLLLVKLHRMQFGRKSEKLQRQIEQLELRLEELESSRREPESNLPEPTPVTVSSTPAKPARRALPDHLPRQTRTHRRKKPYVRNAKANCASWAQMFRRCWSTCPPVSW